MSAPASVGPRAAATPAAWIDRWLAACHDLAELERSNPMTDAVIDEIDGRMIRVGDRWLADFASCNYLGLDFVPDVIATATTDMTKSMLFAFIPSPGRHWSP